MNTTVVDQQANTGLPIKLPGAPLNPPLIDSTEDPHPSLSDWHDYEPNLEFDDTELTHPSPEPGTAAVFDDISYSGEFFFARDGRLSSLALAGGSNGTYDLCAWLAIFSYFCAKLGCISGCFFRWHNPILPACRNIYPRGSNEGFRFPFPIQILAARHKLNLSLNPMAPSVHLFSSGA